MRRFRLSAAVLISAALAVSACSREAEPAAEPPVEPVAAPTPTDIPTIAYACESGATVSARYLDRNTAEVAYQNQTRPMRLVQSASGARYTGGGLEWWTATRGDREEALLSRLGPTGEVGVAVLERCSRPAPNDPLVPTGPGAPEPLAPINGVPACLGPNLRLALAGGDAGAGNRVMVMSLQNIGSTPCYLNGYPKVALFNAQGAELTQVRSEDTPSNYFRANEQPEPVVLAPQARGYFDIAYSAVANEAIGETVCPSATRMRVTAPGDTAAVLLEQALQPCGRRLRVSPVRETEEPQAPAEPETTTEL